MSRIVRCFMNADLRKGHDGLSGLAKEMANIDVNNLTPGEYVVFINTHKNKIKVYAANQVIAYHRHRGRIDMNTIRLIPRSFTGSGMNYDEMLKRAVIENLAARGKNLTVI